ncbi:hypothetical protein B0H13DRAFT_2347321 [Mycena leptocephala]|nr:hypothetical protein B0H13DRAFT_2347321 [Mycena leptocephala]
MSSYRDSNGDAIPEPNPSWEIKLQSHVLLIEHAYETRCQFCRASGFPCTFNKWALHCHECSILGRYRCSFTDYEVWFDNMDRRDREFEVSNNAEDIETLCQRRLARDIAVQEFLHLCNDSRFHASIYTYQTILDTVNSHFILLCILLVLLYLGASRSLVRIVRERIHRLPIA